MTRFFTALGRFSVAFRWPLLVLWIVVTVVCIRALPSLASVTKDTNSGFLPDNTPSTRAALLAAPFQSSTQATVTLVVTRDAGPLSDSDLQAMTALESRVRGFAHVSALRDIGTSRDAQARQALIETTFPPYSVDADAAAFVSDVRAAFPSSTDGAAYHLTGSLALFVDQRSGQQSSQNKVQGATFLLIIVLLLVAFRALLAPLLTLFPAGLVLGLSGPVIALSTHIGVQVSSITQFILIVLVLGAGTDYGIFLVFRVREELRRGMEPKDAVRRAVSTVGESITFSALTVIAALSSLVLAQFGLYQSLGPALAIGIAIMLLAALTLLPALLAIFGRAVFWPSRTRPTERRRESLYGRVARVVTRRPLQVAVVGTVLFAAMAGGSLGARTAGFADQTSAGSTTDSGAGTAALNAHFAAGNINATVVLLRFAAPVWTHPQDLQAPAGVISGSHLFTAVLGPLNPAGQPVEPSQLARVHAVLGEPGSLPPVEPGGLALTRVQYNEYRSEARFISPDGRTVQFVGVTGTGSLSPDSIPAVRALAGQAADAAHAGDNGVFGLQAFAYDVNKLSQDDLSRVIPVVALLIAILLAIVMRSLVAPVYLVLSVLLSYFAALGLVAIVFVHVAGQAGINFVLPFLMFVFLMALGSDYNILVMTRIREEAHGATLRQAVRAAVGATGTTVTTAGVILGGTFAVLALASGDAAGADQIKQIGYGIAVGVLMDTFLIRTMLVPAVVTLLGRWNWWPSRLWREGTDADGGRA